MAIPAGVFPNRLSIVLALARWRSNQSGIAINGGFRKIFPKLAAERRAGFGTIPIGNKPNGHDWQLPRNFSQPIAVVAGFGEIAAEESVMAMIGGFR